MKVRVTLLLLALAAFALTGCERTAYDLGNISAPADAPKYTVEPRIHPPPQ